MTYEWQWFDHAAGVVRVVVEQGAPCVCAGEDLPHPPRLCAAIRAGFRAETVVPSSDLRQIRMPSIGEA